jgi:polar amino acid transport system substrate-binding protein
MFGDLSLYRSMLRLLSLLFIALSLTHCAKRDVLVIATDATYPPFEFKGANGELIGADVEMGRALAAYLGKPVEFQNVAWSGIFTALQTGSADIIISALSATDERRKSIDFSDPYVTTGICLLLPKHSTVQDVNDLKQGKRRIVTKLGTTGDTWSHENLPNAEIIALEDDGACVMELGKGSADAWVYDQISVMNYAQRNPDTTKALLKPIRIEQWAVGMRLGNEELKKKINAFIADYRAKGGFAAIADKYLAKERDFMKQQGLPFVFDLPSSPASR